MSILELIEKRLEENFALHEQYLNPQMVRVLKTKLATIATTLKLKVHTYSDNQGEKYLDLLSGFGVFALDAITQDRASFTGGIDGALPNLVQLDASILAGLLAERLAAIAPTGLERVFLC
jgi:ornithine--oxo-acid transaminase